MFVVTLSFSISFTIFTSSIKRHSIYASKITIICKTIAKLRGRSNQQVQKKEELTAKQEANIAQEKAGKSTTLKAAASAGNTDIYFLI